MAFTQYYFFYYLEWKMTEHVKNNLHDKRLEARKKRRAQAREEAELMKDEGIDETIAESNDLIALQVETFL